MPSNTLKTCAIVEEVSLPHSNGVAVYYIIVYQKPHQIHAFDVIRYGYRAEDAST